MADIGQTEPSLPDTSLPPASSSTVSTFDKRVRSSADWMHRAEQIVYALVGLMLVLALVIALFGGANLLFRSALDWKGSEAVYRIIDRLLFVLMLVEILHTVHASIRSGTLKCEPFLIVGLIACIRRILVITLQTSQITQPDRWDPKNEVLFQSSMIELGVLAALIVVLVGGVWAMSRVAGGGSESKGA